MRTVFFCLLLLLAAVRPAMAEATWDGEKAAFFGVTYLDLSHEGALSPPREDEAARVAMVEEIIAEALEAQGLELVDLSPVAVELDRMANPANCVGCDVRIAARLGARYAVVAEVKKVSNLILSMGMAIRDAETGARVRAYAVDIRGNTDESWARGMRYILKNGIFRE